MMCSNRKISFIAPKTASALALAISRAGAVFFFFLAAVPFAIFAQVQDVRVVNTPNVVIDGQPIEVWSDSTFWVDMVNSPTVYIGGLSDDNALGYLPVGVVGDVQIIQKANTLLKVDVDMGDSGSTFGEWALEMINYASKLDGISYKLSSVLTNIAAQANVINNIQDYSQTTSYNSTNLPLIKNTLDDALYNYNEETAENESVAKILSQIRDNGIGSDFSLGTAFTNLASAIAYEFLPTNASTNYNNIVSALASSEGEFYSKYGLQPLYYNSIFSGLPIGQRYNVGQGLNPYGVPNMQWNNFHTYRNQMLMTLRHKPSFLAISNQLSSASDLRYHLYNTYQSRAMLSNLFYNANMVTWTNMQAAGISPDNFAMHWFDSYNTKFQNMLLQYANAESMTNENINVPEFARRWYETYNTLKSGLAGEYLVNHDIIEGTNSFQDVAYEVTSQESTWKQYLPTWGIEDENGELELGEIQQRQDSGYKSEMDDLKTESVANSEYIQSGLDLISDLKDEYSDFTLRLEGLVGSTDDSLQLRIIPFQSELVPLQEDYINFKMSQAVKDKLTWFWWVLDGIIRMGILSWSFFHLWGVLMGREFIGGSK